MLPVNFVNHLRRDARLIESWPGLWYKLRFIGKGRHLLTSEVTMKRWLVITMWLLIAFAGVHYSQAASGQASAGWTTLFDGSSLDNWNQIGDANWKLADGIVQADKGNGFLVSKDSWGHFEGQAEFWVDGEHSGGMFLLFEDLQQGPAHNACEL